MKQRIRYASIAAGNPLANALMLVVAALAVAAAIVLGFFAFIVLGGILLILAGIIGIRLWWLDLRRRRNFGVRGPRSGADSSPGSVIEGEYKVVTKSDARESKNR